VPEVIAFRLAASLYWLADLLSRRGWQFSLGPLWASDGQLCRHSPDAHPLFDTADAARLMGHHPFHLTARNSSETIAQPHSFRLFWKNYWVCV
jgi:hypothetical protein